MNLPHLRSHSRVFLIALLIAGFVSCQKITGGPRPTGKVALPPRVSSEQVSGSPSSPDLAVKAGGGGLRAPVTGVEAAAPETGEPGAIAVVVEPTPSGAPEGSGAALEEGQAAPPPGPEILPSPTAGPDPLRFVFPSPGPVPVSAWRPPLYPTPWEPTPYDHFYFGRPIAADEVNWPLPDYRYGGVFFKDFVHTGVDIPVPTGTPVLAAGSGRVTWTGYGLLWGNDDPTDPYGLAVVIKHDFGYQGERLFTIYAHMDRIEVMKGQQVETGETLGLSGATGNVTGPHLHFEVRVGKSNFHLSRNPELWIAPPQGWGVVAARVMNESGGLLHRQAVRLRNNDTGQVWMVDTYGKGSANSDHFYQENMVIGDLPGGSYTFWIQYEGKIFEQDLMVNPGRVSYFRFYGEEGFSLEPPEPPEAGFHPPEEGAYFDP
jgi:murein DD-endopeptidase MepM/ murein hydrolase activator NlpD